jgi:hypothetical protein
LSLNNFTDDNILEHNNDELDKEFKKILCWKNNNTYKFYSKDLFN